METLAAKFYKKRDRVPVDFKRYLHQKIDWNDRLIGIKGARGAGKTTLLLQYIALQLPQDHQTLYASLDDLYFTENRLADLADAFVKQGGRFLLLDEVHRYSNWSQELKNIYDDHPDLHVVFTGSSIIHLDKAKGDLSRRAVMYELFGLSFREYLELVTKRSLDAITLEHLLEDHVNHARNIVKILRPFEHFKNYLQYGYYPYFIENNATYPLKLAETISLALSADLPASHDISYASIEKIRLLLHIIAESVPFKPNISKLSERTGVTRNSLVNYLHYLEDLRVIRGLHNAVKDIGLLQKPEKIYLHHPNLYIALADTNSNIGNMRESFFINQVAVVKPVSYIQDSDFRIADTVFEIGGKDKSSKQIRHLDKAYVVADDIEIGYQQKIPLWLFGFLY
ncbi:ATP-binding protein (plasmid) [Pedobacter sp. BS3]|uniref:ATP-binding protein n=1 Tax=Pedobacter sp. BS3 TaxID=2567937 RepID=UPI0011EFDEE6|nr:AAA family ATPase [Pedobacter sp. BS3]TZF85851.1 ATP-binding protein [Pedobacter sp. BS3]